MGRPTNLGCPSTTSTSLSNAFTLFLARALATVRSNRLTSSGFSESQDTFANVVDIQPGVPEIEPAHLRHLVHPSR